MTIRSVLFDLDGTLKVNVPTGMEAFLEYSRQLGIRIDEEAVPAGERWNHWYWAQSEPLAADLALKDEMAFWVQYSSRLLEALGANGVNDAQAQAVTRQFADYAPVFRLNDGACETLAGLQSAGYTLGLVSNRSTRLDQTVADLGLESFFAFTLAAGEVGIWKPDPGILEEAMRRGRCSPESSAYVGDNYYADVTSAREAGLTPVLLDPRGIFAHVDCRVIRVLTELLDWLA